MASCQNPPPPPPNLSKPLWHRPAATPPIGPLGGPCHGKGEGGGSNDPLPAQAKDPPPLSDGSRGADFLDFAAFRWWVTPHKVIWGGGGGGQGNRGGGAV